jgi:hypothetical protein
MSTSHPNILKCVDIIKKEQAFVEATILQLRAGGRLAPKRRKYQQIDFDIRQQQLLLLTGQKTPIEYADCVSHFVGL